MYIYFPASKSLHIFPRVFVFCGMLYLHGRSPCIEKVRSPVFLALMGAGLFFCLEFFTFQEGRGMIVRDDG